jgi:hypothetical protein
MKRKLLALAVAVIFILGTVATGFAADFKDVENADCKNAVTKLSALGIISGFPDGTFRPAEPVTRAQMAKIIVTAAGVGNAAQYAAGITKYSDVPASHWASGYINVASDMGIIQGYGDGRFGPEDQVTYAQAITMIVRALGYEPKAKALGGYPGGYLTVAAEKEITDGVTVVGSLVANRGDIALMISNSLTVPMMVQKTWGEFPEYAEDENQTLLKKLGVTELEGVRVVANKRVNDTLKDNELKLSNGKIYTIKFDGNAEYLFGLQVTAWIKSSDLIGVEIETDVFFDAVKEDGGELKLVGAGKKYSFADKVAVYVNGEEEENFDFTDFVADYAKVVLDDDGKVAFVDAYEWTDFIAVEEVEGDVVYGYGDELDLEDWTVVKDGKSIAVKDIKEGDILFYNESAEYAEVYNKSYKGKIEKVYDDSFKIAGKEFDYEFDALSGGALYADDNELKNFDANVADDMKEEGGVVEVFVDRHGNAILVFGDTGEAETSTFYAYVIEDASEYDIRNKGYYNLDVVNEKGKEVKYDIAAEDAQKWGIDSLKARTVVKIEVDEDGDVVGVKILEPNDTGITFKTDDSYVNGKKLLSSAIVFDIEDYTEDVDDIVVSTLGKADFDEVKKGDIYVDDEDRVVVIVVEESDKETDETDYTAVAIADRKKVTGKDIWRLNLNIDGKEVTYYTKDGKVSVAADVYEGMFVKVTVDGKTDEITGCKILDNEESARVVEGRVVSRSTRDLTLEVGGTTYRLDDATILDATDDYAVIRIRDLAVDDNVKILLVSDGSRYAKYVVKTELVKTE